MNKEEEDKINLDWVSTANLNINVKGFPLSVYIIESYIKKKSKITDEILEKIIKRANLDLFFQTESNENINVTEYLINKALDFKIKISKKNFNKLKYHSNWNRYSTLLKLLDYTNEFTDLSFQKKKKNDHKDYTNGSFGLIKKYYDKNYHNANIYEKLMFIGSILSDVKKIDDESVSFFMQIITTNAMNDKEKEFISNVLINIIKDKYEDKKNLFNNIEFCYIILKRNLDNYDLISNEVKQVLKLNKENSLKIIESYYNTGLINIIFNTNKQEKAQEKINLLLNQKNNININTKNIQYEINFMNEENKSIASNIVKSIQYLKNYSIDIKNIEQYKKVKSIIEKVDINLLKEANDYFLESKLSMLERDILDIKKLTLAEDINKINTKLENNEVKIKQLDLKFEISDCYVTQKIEDIKNKISFININKYKSLLNYEKNLLNKHIENLTVGLKIYSRISIEDINIKLGRENRSAKENIEALINKVDSNLDHIIQFEIENKITKKTI